MEPKYRKFKHVGVTGKGEDKKHCRCRPPFTPPDFPLLPFSGHLSHFFAIPSLKEPLQKKENFAETVMSICLGGAI